MAILYVWLFHYISSQGVWTDGAPGPAQGTFLFHFQRLFSMGWAGVDLFFVLSGFLIGGILLDNRDSPKYFKTFYGRRFYRIVPLYYLWIAVYSVIALFQTTPETWRAVPIYLLFLQNSVKIVHANLGTAWLGALWSLAVEEQFYLLMPLAVRYLPQRSLVILLCMTIVGAPMMRLAISVFVPQHPAAPYSLTICRADALAMGVLVAVGWRTPEWKARLLRYKAAVFGVGFLLLTAVVFLACWNPSPYSRTMFTWGFSSIDAFCALLLAIGIMFPNGLWASVCRNLFLSELGRVSYCLYVIHMAVNFMCHQLLLGGSPRFMNWRSIGATVLAAMLAFGLAELSWRFFEGPLLRRGHALRYWTASHERVNWD